MWKVYLLQLGTVKHEGPRIEEAGGGQGRAVLAHWEVRGEKKQDDVARYLS